MAGFSRIPLVIHAHSPKHGDVHQALLSLGVKWRDSNATYLKLRIDARDEPPPLLRQSKGAFGLHILSAEVSGMWGQRMRRQEPQRHRAYLHSRSRRSIHNSDRNDSAPTYRYHQSSGRAETFLRWLHLPWHSWPGPQKRYQFGAGTPGSDTLIPLAARHRTSTATFHTYTQLLAAACCSSPKMKLRFLFQSARLVGRLGSGRRTLDDKLGISLEHLHLTPFDFCRARLLFDDLPRGFTLAGFPRDGVAFL